MRIPKEIENTLKRRTAAAIKWIEADYIVSQFIDENDIDCEDYDYHGGVDAIVNPAASANRIRKTIAAKKAGDKA